MKKRINYILKRFLFILLYTTIVIITQYIIPPNTFKSINLLRISDDFTFEDTFVIYHVGIFISFNIIQNS